MPYLVTGLIVAVFATGCTYLVQLCLAKQARKWEEKRHIARTAERFCDELMALATTYWSKKPVDGENKADIRLLEQKISAYNELLRRFLKEHFFHNPDIPEYFLEMATAVAGGSFGTVGREADGERVADSVAAIVQLRLAISRTAAK